ncbi:protein-export chaperone SecB [Sphingomicrobium flavum]|uniref:protein-export chaperone SecB n=1 Tax=Sphingomicrobium flavum TaxID=1229164 RepID=UPI0021AD834F|nr:protein-export chaperone SecB [Sphingomicrobium flavum]
MADNETPENDAPKADAPTGDTPQADPVAPPPPPQAEGTNPDNAPQIANLVQYVKDLSVENPNSPAVFQWKGQPRIDVNFNIAVEQAGEGLREVILKVEAQASTEEGVQFIVDLTYAGLYGFRNIDEAQLHPFFYVEAPTMLFPFARQVVAEAVGNAGFPPLMLEPIDFRGTYLREMANQQVPAATNGASGLEPKADA